MHSRVGWKAARATVELAPNRIPAIKGRYRNAIGAFWRLRVVGRSSITGTGKSLITVLQKDFLT
jgi:hypothetical protein